MKIKRKPHLVGEFQPMKDVLNLSEGWVAFDTETTGLDPWGTMGVDRPTWPARAFCVSLCDPDGNTAFERWPVDPFTRKVIATPSPMLMAIFGSEKIAKRGFNAIFDRRMLRKAGVKLKGKFEDVLLMAHVLDPDAFDKRLKPLCAKYCDMAMDDQDLVHASAKAMRLKVRSAKLKVRKGDCSDPALLELARYKLSEPLRAEWEEVATRDDDSVMGDCFLADPVLLEKYAREDALRTASLYEACAAELDRRKADGGRSWDVYRDAQELAIVVERMEDRAIRVDKDRNVEIVNDYFKIMNEHWAEIEKIMGPDFKPNSWKQKQKYFFIDNDFVPIRYSEKKVRRVTKKPPCQWCKGMGCKVCQQTGRSPKCDGEFLESIGVDKTSDKPKPKNKLAWHMLHWGAAKTMTSFCSAYERYIVKDSEGNWVLHPNYKQVGPVTDRFSAENPNMQNVSADDSGKKKVDIPYRSREPFIPRKGRCFYIPDYSQIEIWMLMLQSGDVKLREILLAGGDTHGKVAATVVPNACDFDQAIKDKNIDPKKLTTGRASNLKAYNKTRKKAKNTQFCKVYGGGVAKIAQTAGCTLDEAEEFVERYEGTFTGITSFMRNNILECRRDGGVESVFGMWYPIDYDRAYVSTNYKIQGSSAQLIKRAMVRVEKICVEKYDEQAELLLTIHDELLLDVDLSIDRLETMKDIASAMQADYKFLGCPVPFPVGMKVAYDRWSESKEIKL